MTDHALTAAKKAALKAGQILKSNQGKLTHIRHKGKRDLVSEADLASQAAVIEIIEQEFPDHRIMAEEENRSNIPELNSDNTTLKGPLWIIDPLDGTTNFVHGVAYFCVSICLTIDGDLEVGVIYDPIKDELFSATRGKGAFLNGTPISVSSTGQLSESLIVTGFPYKIDPVVDDVLAMFKNILLSSQGITRLGSAALDLAHVAAGRMEGFWEVGLNPWDIAAGALIVKEAGGKVSDLSGYDLNLFNAQIVATNGLIHDEFLSRLKPEKYLKNRL